MSKRPSYNELEANLVAQSYIPRSTIYSDSHGTIDAVIYNVQAGLNYAGEPMARFEATKAGETQARAFTLLVDAAAYIGIFPNGSVQ